MAKITIHYELSEAGRKKSLLAGGDGYQEQTLEVEATQGLLERATVSRDGVATWDVRYKPLKYAIYGAYNFNSCGADVYSEFYEEKKPHISTVAGSQYIYFDEPQTAESLLAYMKCLEAEVAADKAKLEAQLPERIALWEKGVAEHKAKIAKSLLRREAEHKAEQTAKEDREAERLAWIEANGSKYLQRAVRLGYNCQRQYVAERLALELPEYELDFDKRAYWNSHSCPSEEAIDQVEKLIKAGYAAEVVWLTGPVTAGEGEDSCHKPFAPCEAIVIREYLGEYSLVKIM